MKRPAKFPPYSVLTDPYRGTSLWNFQRENSFIQKISSQNGRNFARAALEGRSFKILRTGGFYLRIINFIKPSVKSQTALSDLQVSKNYLSYLLCP